jgi:hypothetical protein
MFRVLSTITFVQQSSATFPMRNTTLTYNFCHSFEIESSWKNLTDKAKIILPKNVYVLDSTGKPVSLGALVGSPDNVNIGGFSTTVPLFLRGDQVTIQDGYAYFDSRGNEVFQMDTVFQGYISQVTSKKPIELECEDNMWKLKQIIAPNQVFPATQYTLEGILQSLLAGTGFTVNVLTNTSFGDFRTQNETVADVLARLRKDYHFESYFRGTELRCGAVVYVEQDAITDGTQTFQFQQNIISDDLEYRRRDDLNLSAIAYSVNKNALQVLTKDGHTKTKQERLEVLVTIRPDGTIVNTPKPANQKADYAPNTAGERRTLYFWNVTDLPTLEGLAANELTKYFYKGFHGKFTTFGLPYVRHGDNVNILDPVLVERNGQYKVKAVKYSGGVGGLRQDIELDYLITRLDGNGNPIS